MATRDLCEVIEKLLPLVREGEGCEEAAHDLQKISDSAAFTAPEVMGVRWQAAQDVLVKNVRESHPRRKEIAQIWNNTTDEPVESR